MSEVTRTNVSIINKYFKFAKNMIKTAEKRINTTIAQNSGTAVLKYVNAAQIGQYGQNFALKNLIAA